MVKKTGRACLLKISDGTGGFTAFAGLNTKSLKINNARIDITTPDPTTPEGPIWRETLDGEKSVSVSGDGRLVQDASETRLFAMSLAQDTTDTFEIVFPNVGTFSGVFSAEIELSGADDATFSVSLESSGVITFAAA